MQVIDDIFKWTQFYCLLCNCWKTKNGTFWSRSSYEATEIYSFNNISEVWFVMSSTNMWKVTCYCFLPRRETLQRGSLWVLLRRESEIDGESAVADDGDESAQPQSKALKQLPLFWPSAAAAATGMRPETWAATSSFLCRPDGLPVGREAEEVCDSSSRQAAAVAAVKQQMKWIRHLVKMLSGEAKLWDLRGAGKVTVYFQAGLGVLDEPTGGAVRRCCE